MPTLEWIGKDKVINHHLDVPYRVLERKYSYDENGQHEEDNSSENMIIHGDNLDALKALLPRYEGRVKCIYIDPPYNTAKSSEKNKTWVYSDNVDDPRIQKWLNTAVGDEGEDLSRHDKWLCMMYPRLKLLHQLMSSDGIIFISIDDNEEANLRVICDDIFGKRNFISQLVWRSDGNFDNQAKIKVCHEYILCYSKTPDALGLPNGIDPNVTDKSKIFKDEIRNTVVKNGPKNPMSVVTLPKGFPCAVEELTIEERYDSFPYYFSKAIIHNGRLQEPVDVKSGWSSKKILLSFIANDFKPTLDSKSQLTSFEITSTGAIEMVKRRDRISHVLSVLSNLGSTQNMSNELAQMGIKFDFPKPTDLIKYLIEMYATGEDIVLDSFAGSGTTAHAVLNANKADGGSRKFILVEMMDYADSITAERAKRVISGYKADQEITLFDEKITLENLSSGEDLLNEAKRIAKEAKGQFSSVKKPKIEEGHLKVVAVNKAKDQVAGLGGDFSYYELGEPLMHGDMLNEDVGVEKIREYVYFTETKRRLAEPHADEPYYMGVHVNSAYYFYYERDTVTTLNREFLHTIKTKADAYVIYADLCMLSDAELEKYHITFKKIPRDITKL